MILCVPLFVLLAKSSCAFTFVSQNHNPSYRCVERSSRLLSTLYLSAREIRDRLGLNDRFDRWRYMQKVLEEETCADDINEVVYLTLKGYLKFPRPKFQGTDETGSPELTAKLRRSVERALEFAADDRINIVVDPGGEINENLYAALHDILPDPIENEDDNQSTWDIVMDLNGRESVKQNEREARNEWKTRCLATRILIHYDFLSYGLLDAPIME